MDKRYYVYIMASRYDGATYIGVTGNLQHRIFQHREGLIEGYTKRFKIKRLVYYEDYSQISLAIDREKKLKKWKRSWKVALIEKHNPQWKDLYPNLGF